MKENKTYEVDLELLQEIANYLQTRPYNEVYELMNKIILLTHEQEQ